MLDKEKLIELMEVADDDDKFHSDFCTIWFDLDKKTIYGEDIYGRKLQTSGKNDILKSWRDVVMNMKSSTTLDDVKAITSKYGYTILEGF